MHAYKLTAYNDITHNNSSPPHTKPLNSIATMISTQRKQHITPIFQFLLSLLFVITILLSFFIPSLFHPPFFSLAFAKFTIKNCPKQNTLSTSTDIYNLFSLFVLMERVSMTMTRKVLFCKIYYNIRPQKYK